MADIANEMVQLDAKVAEINEAIRVLDGENDTLTAQLQANVAKRMELRKQREGLSKLRDSAAVKQRIVTQEDIARQAAEAAKKSQADADATLARLAEKEKQLDDLIAKAAMPQG